MTLYSRADLVKILILTSIFVLLAKTMVLIFGSNNTVSFLWLATGPALAVCIASGYRFLLAVLLGSLLGYALGGQSIDVTLGASFRHTGVVWAALWLFRRSGRFDLALASLSDFFRILALGLGMGAMATLTVMVQQRLNLPYPGTYTLGERLAGTALGIIIIVPLVLAWQSPPEEWATPRKALEALLILGLTVLAGQVVFFTGGKSNWARLCAGTGCFPLSPGRQSGWECAAPRW